MNFGVKLDPSSNYYCNDHLVKRGVLQPKKLSSHIDRFSFQYGVPIPKKSPRGSVQKIRSMNRSGMKVLINVGS